MRAVKVNSKVEGCKNQSNELKDTKKPDKTEENYRVG